MVRRMATKRRPPARQIGGFRGGVIVAKPYKLLEDSVESGIKWGIRRVFKYRDTDAITEDELLNETQIDTILNCIMVEIAERFDFPEPPEGA